MDSKSVNTTLGNLRCKYSHFRDCAPRLNDMQMHNTTKKRNNFTLETKALTSQVHSMNYFYLAA